jgi:hypothetical protein
MRIKKYDKVEAFREYGDDVWERVNDYLRRQRYRERFIWKLWRI